MLFTQEDLDQIKGKGIATEDAEKQLFYLNNGFPALSIVGPATPENGILQLTQQEQEACEARYNQWGGSRIKFVPASGAATRMFKDLYVALDALEKTEEAPLGKEATLFFEKLKQYPFYNFLAQQVNINDSPKAALLQALLNDGLGYGHLPKGLLPFHMYPEGPRTAFEEHLVEAALYATDAKQVARLHFTVSPEHENAFRTLLARVRHIYAFRYGVTFDVSFSTQQPQTDTLATDEAGNPFRNPDGTLLFRPGGHGALLANLNQIQEDVIFIKNIDNVVPESRLLPVVHWKRVLAGLLLSCRKQTSAYIAALQYGAKPLMLKEIAQFLEQTFGVTHPPMAADQYPSYLFAKLNRPIRVCGMVRQMGEPGGGPFRVTDTDGSGSRQILESVQLLGKSYPSTHFNPVDIVCSIKDYEGKPYNLAQYRDDKAGFISQKSVNGKVLHALELPGLWNGGMSDWNTVFVEVPLSTFNPVKSVSDLLRKEHNSR